MSKHRAAVQPGLTERSGSPSSDVTKSFQRVDQKWSGKQIAQPAATANRPLTGSVTGIGRNCTGSFRGKNLGPAFHVVVLLSFRPKRVEVT